MCGICGIVSQKGLRDVGAILRRMTYTMRHRGPDDEGYVEFDGGGFGFRRLSVIDLAGSHQPLSNEDRRVWAVCNGEIYNYIELRAALTAKGHVFSTQGDVETVVHAYEEWGTACFERLRGMFGIALWDDRSRRLILARDRLGIKPMYYAALPDRLVFGSELKTVMADSATPADVDWDAISLYLSLLYVPGPRTCYRHVRKLQAGTWLEWRADGLRTDTYWRYRRRNAEPSGKRMPQRNCSRCSRNPCACISKRMSQWLSS